MEDDEKAVVITHFINPYQFWYCSLDEESYIKVRDIEEELTKYFKFNYGPMLRDTEIGVSSEIAVRYLPRNKFIRVQVKEVLRNQKNAISYIVWSYDHGFAFETQAQFCRHLPHQFNVKIDRVRCGGIEKIVPAALEFDFLEQKQVTVLKEKWCKRACDSLNKIILDAASVEFVERFNGDGQYWGDLVVSNHHGNVQHASDFLINQDVAVRSIEKFKKTILIPKRYLTPIWQTNDGNNNYKKNVSPPKLHEFSLNERKFNLNNTEFQSAQIKVAAWEDFNKNAVKNSVSNSSLFENLDSASTLYDDVDDSVSKVALNSPTNGKFHTSARGAKRNHGGPTKKIAPVPTLDDFGISENEVGASVRKGEIPSNVSSASTIHSRSQYLHIMRLKHMQEKNKAAFLSCDTELAKQQENDALTKSFESNTPERSSSNLVDKFHEFSLKQPSVVSSKITSHVPTKKSELNNDQEMNMLHKLTLSKCNDNNLSELNAASLNVAHGTISNQLEKFMLSRGRTSPQFISHDEPYVSPADTNSLNNDEVIATNPVDKLLRLPKHSASAETTLNAKANYLNQLRIKSAQIGTNNSKENLPEDRPEAPNNSSKSKNLYQNAVMLPAGFDLANLNKYNNKEHWHCKETTRNQDHNQDFRFTRANTDKQKNTENKMDCNKWENPNHLTMQNSLPTPTSSKEATPQQNKITQKFKFSDAEDNADHIEEDNDANDFVDVYDEDNGDDDGDKSRSRASSRVSMYSAQSSLGDGSKTIEAEIPKKQLAENALKSNPFKDLLQNFIKTKTLIDNEPKRATPQPVSQPLCTQNSSSDASQSVPCLTGDREFRLNYFQHTVLAHGVCEVKPIESLNKILLAPDVCNAMTSRGFNRVSRTQSYAWPHMLQGNSLFVVNPPDSCKTWCYIPTLCTAVINCIENELAPKVNGPLAIVLVASSDRAITVSNYCSHLLRKLERPDGKTICSYGVREIIQTKVLLMEGCAILVATPPNFRRLLEDNQRKDPLLNSQRLRHIIIDDIDVMLSRCKADFTSVLKSLYVLAPKVKDTKKFLPQLVVTSRCYSPMLQKLIPISNQPLLVIGDFLEAAIYGKAKICFEICAKTQKIQRIIEFINEHPYKNESLIILCNRDEDVFTICEQLQLSGLDCLGCHSEASLLVRHQVHKWKLPAYIHSKVLVCTDSVLHEFEIQNVQNLIHYSLAGMWAKMKFRFSVHKEMYLNLVKNNFSENKSDKKVATSLILLDEENNEELPRIFEFLKSHNQLKYISPDVVKLSRHIRLLREKERCKADNQFCDLFFEYGECDKLICPKRHTLTEDDVNTGVDKEPLIQRGDLRMLVLNVYSPTHYAVRLLEHRSSSAADWTCIRQSDKAAAFAMKFNFFYMNSDNLNRHWPVRVNDVCVLERNGSFCRVRVLEVPTLKNENIVKSLDVMIKLIDDGDIITEKSDYLYACHEKFKDFPAQSHNVRLIGLRPLDNETSWDADTTFYVKSILMNKLQKNESVCASVSLSLVDTIVVRNLFVMRKLPTLGNYIVGTDLKRDLVNKDYAVIDKNGEQRIHKIIGDYGFDKVLGDTAEENTKITVDSQHENEDSSFNVEEVGMEKIELEILANIPKKHETKTDPINGNLANTLKRKYKSIKSRSEFIRHLQNAQKTQTLEGSSIIQNETPEALLPETCSFLEFLKVLQRSNELDAEDYDLEADGMEQVRDYIYQTDQLCKLEIMRELERQNSNTKKRAIAAPPPPPKDDEIYHTIPNPQIDLLPRNELKSPALEEESLKIDNEMLETRTTNLPPLHNIHKRPQTSWYETNQLIFLSIRAPDIEDYYLEVEKTFVYFMAAVDGVEQVLVLNFIGTVEPQYTSHEIRGLYVIVRLVKSLFMPWPRLLKQEEKMPWLSYNFNMLNVEELEKLLPQQFIDRVLNNQRGKPQNVDDDTDESDDELETYTSIINNDDIHDPINAERF